MSKVCQLFSGSSGNSIYIESKNTKILVDAGVSAKRIENALSGLCDPSDINAVIVTHEHSDHTKGLRVFASRYGIPVFAPEKCLEKMICENTVSEKVECHTARQVQIGNIDVSPFRLSHDSVDCFGYSFALPDGRKVSVCTDTGYVTDQAEKSILGSDLVFLESNHEVTMVENGPYPYPLKQRILSDCGHLSNFACAEFAVRLAQSGTTRFVLSHLSKENNYPEIARQTTLSALNGIDLKEGTDFRLYVSPAENKERPIVL